MDSLDPHATTPRVLYLALSPSQSCVAGHRTRRRSTISSRLASRSLWPGATELSKLEGRRKGRGGCACQVPAGRPLWPPPAAPPPAPSRVRTQPRTCAAAARASRDGSEEPPLYLRALRASGCLLRAACQAASPASPPPQPPPVLPPRPLRHCSPAMPDALHSPPHDVLVPAEVRPSLPRPRLSLPRPPLTFPRRGQTHLFICPVPFFLCPEPLVLCPDLPIFAQTPSFFAQTPLFLCPDPPQSWPRPPPNLCPDPQLTSDCGALLPDHCDELPVNCRD